MPDSPLISVIVPVYNTEKYLRKCLDSICSQTYRNLEILCVNDGSTDGSAAILEEYAARDARIRVFHQPNAGQSAARNLALSRASGEWVTGVDSDDYMAADAYEYALTATTERVDIVCFGTNVIWEEREPEPHLIQFFEILSEGVYTPTPRLISETNDSFWNKLWRKELLDRLNAQFPEGLWYEDSFFWRAVAPFARDISFLSEKKVNYVRHGESIMSRVFKKDPKTMDRVLIAELLMEYYKGNHLPVKLSEVELDAFLFYFTTALSDVPKTLHSEVWVRMRQIAQDHGLLKMWPERMGFLLPVPMLLRPFVRHHGPGKSSYGIPGFRPLVIQRKNGMRIIRFLGIKIHRSSI